jgi:hypothetical protein
MSEEVKVFGALMEARVLLESMEVEMKSES